jgi:hypothetical protein
MGPGSYLNTLGMPDPNSLAFVRSSREKEILKESKKLIANIGVEKLS